MYYKPVALILSSLFENYFVWVILSYDLTYRVVNLADSVKTEKYIALCKKKISLVNCIRVYYICASVLII